MKTIATINQTELRKILEVHFERLGSRLVSATVRREDNNGDPRESPAWFVDCSIELLPRLLPLETAERTP